MTRIRAKQRITPDWDKLARAWQPRIPGVRREPRHVGLLPDVSAAIARRAAASGITFSRAAAEMLSQQQGVDAATGKKLRRRVVLTFAKRRAS